MIRCHGTVARGIGALQHNVGTLSDHTVGHRTTNARGGSDHCSGAGRHRRVEGDGVTRSTRRGNHRPNNRGGWRVACPHRLRPAHRTARRTGRAATFGMVRPRGVRGTPGSRRVVGVGYPATDGQRGTDTQRSQRDRTHPQPGIRLTVLAASTRPPSPICSRIHHVAHFCSSIPVILESSNRAQKETSVVNYCNLAG